MFKPHLNTCIPSPTRWFNRVYTLVYSIVIFALLYHHCCNLIYSPSSTTIFLLVADLVLAFMWALSQPFFLNPVHRRVFPQNLPQVVKESEYPGLDVFICTADPFKEPPIRVVNTVLSVLAYEYPTDKLSVYVSDDGGSQVTLFALLEAAKFAKHWLPYCRKYDILDRSPEVYFGNHQLLLPDAYEIKVMYESMKARIDKAVKKGILSPDQITNDGWIKILNKWTSGFTPKDHPAVLLESNKDSDITCHSLPNLIYVSREKNNAINHHFKAGALNTLIRVSAVITNAPIFLVLDCDMYSNNPKTTLYALCHFLDLNVDTNLAFIQFPQCFHDINNNDTYGAELLFDNRSNPRGMDGLLRVMFLGSGGFLKRQALLGCPKLVDPSVMPKEKTHHPRKESIVCDDVLQLAHHVAGSRFEENTAWGLEMGFRYGSLVEDVNTSFRLQCQGWTSMFCDPERASFLGNSPKSLNDILNQSKRWCIGLLEMAMSKHNPITYGLTFMNPLHALCYTYYNFWAFWAFWAIPIVIYAFLPQLALLNSSSIFPKVSNPWFLLYIFLFFGAYTKNLLEFMFAGGVFIKWWNNQRMWLVLGCSSYPFAIAEWVLKSLGLSTREFIVTSKVIDDDLSKRYKKCLFEFGVESPLFLTISVAAVVNLLSFVMGIIQVVRKGRFEELCAQLLIVEFGVVNSWPIYDAMVLRSDKGKMPLITTLKAIGVALVICSASSSVF
ncbi:hypothetical protein L1987_42117 [Smallanthus sonchifolius]|uniref:Uncharacterized protein n=1 Tax=Smallanthus sonchifolius TaxID=185202 RepID=A0ACB9GWJ7_9ASTR|nr:hypothetical protein L1987_42117 [Smallanthus sonchifolius]